MGVVNRRRRSSLGYALPMGSGHQSKTRRVAFVRHALACALLFAVGCGASTPTPATSSGGVRAVGPKNYLLHWAAEWQPLLAPPGATSEELRAQVRELRGRERQEATLRYANALIRDMAQAEAEEDTRGMRRARREFRRVLRRLARVRGDLAAVRDFIDLLASWRLGEERAQRLAERFTGRHEEPRELHGLAWMILGELQLEAEDLNDAATSFRYLMGDLEHPLYPFALWRTAEIHGARGEESEQRELQEQLVRMGCDPDVREETAMVAAAVAREAGIPRVEGRYAVCVDGGADARDAENELPPGYR